MIHSKQVQIQNSRLPTQLSHQPNTLSHSHCHTPRYDDINPNTPKELLATHVEILENDVVRQTNLLGHHLEEVLAFVVDAVVAADRCRLVAESEAVDESNTNEIHQSPW